LLDATRTEAAVVAVVGAPDARAALLSTATPWSEWEHRLARGRERLGAIWLQADGAAGDQSSPGPDTVLAHADAWRPGDMLLLPLRGAGGDVIGVVSVDEPQTGLRPDDAELEVLVTVAAHGAFAIEQAQRGAARAAGEPAARAVV
jgi:hypothetical protein